MKKLLTKKIGDKTLVWFTSKNEYAVFPTVTASILTRIDDKISLENIAKDFAIEFNIPYKEAYSFITDIEQKVYQPNSFQEKHESKHRILPTVINYEVVKFYKVNNYIFKINFQTEKEAFWIHPKFAHLEIQPQEKSDFVYHVFSENTHTFLFVDNSFIGSWMISDIHYFQGKFSMELVQSIHQKKEHEWMGVFHASAVSNGKNSILFLGDSGNGKSTSLALLQANGFTCIADDFVPIDAKKQEVYSFPSAISIKKNSIPHLLSLYPELETTAEYHLKSLNKIVRYLPPNNDDYSKHVPCKALIFIKYKPDVDLKVNQISIIEAFEKLVPDSWLSPEIENAQIFLDWFSQLPCYELSYSNNEKMITTVQKLFNNEL